MFAGCEFSDQTDPFEAGIGFAVPLKSKPDDFIGRAALEQRKARPVKKLVGLELSGGVVPSTGDCVRIGKAQVGEITSAVKSPMLGKNIALARLDVTHAAVGTEVEVGQLDGQQKRLSAVSRAVSALRPAKEARQRDLRNRLNLVSAGSAVRLNFTSRKTHFSPVSRAIRGFQLASRWEHFRRANAHELDGLL